MLEENMVKLDIFNIAALITPKFLLYGHFVSNHPMAFHLIGPEKSLKLNFCNYAKRKNQCPDREHLSDH